jgi:hypothetical protein
MTDTTLILFEEDSYKASELKDKYRRLDNHDLVITLLAMKVKHYAISSIDKQMFFTFIASDTENIMMDFFGGKEITVNILDVFKAEKIWKDYLIMMKMRRS